ncbi:hypothetical protein V6V47_02585 [Micromonospora sp. CPCC 205539]|uniref:hypothetical protein n=1 Tax=Micromonospora sp. CPCC 205539 TaxID=3122408 RepID=UPI002FF1B8DC
MTNDIEEQLTSGMRQEVAGVAFGSDVLGAATRRHGRRVALQRTSYAAGVVGLVGALAAAVLIGGPGASTPGGDPAASASDSSSPSATGDTPQLQLASAVTASENVSYRLKITTGSKEDPNAWGTAEGAWDPARSTGWLTTQNPGGVGYYQRMVDGTFYVGSSGSTTWKQEPNNGNLEYADALGGATGASADPKELFAALREANAKVTKTGARTYHFESTRTYDDKYAAGTRTLVGDVTVGADGRIAKVSYLATDTSRVKPGVKSPKAGLTLKSDHRLTLQLSDYGVPVRVERPKNVIVAR